MNLEFHNKLWAFPFWKKKFAHNAHSFYVLIYFSPYLGWCFVIFLLIWWIILFVVLSINFFLVAYSTCFVQFIALQKVFLLLCRPSFFSCLPLILFVKGRPKDGLTFYNYILSKDIFLMIFFRFLYYTLFKLYTTSS